MLPALTALRRIAKHDPVLFYELCLLFSGIGYIILYGVGTFFGRTYARDVLTVVFFSFGVIFLVLICIRNISVEAAKKVLVHPKLWSLFALVTVFTVLNVTQPSSLISAVNTVTFFLSVTTVLTVDVHIRRHRSLFITILCLVVIATALNIYVWTFTSFEQGVVLVVVQKKVFLKRDVLRSILLSLSAQMLEGVVTMLKSQGMRGIYVFIRTGCPRPLIDWPQPYFFSYPIPIRRLAAALVFNQVIIFACFLAFGVYHRRRVVAPTWVIALDSLALACFCLLSFGIFSQNTKFSVFREMTKQTNLWVILVLLVGFIASASSGEGDAFGTLASVSCSTSLIVFIAMDALVITDWRCRLAIGVIGAITCVFGLIAVVILPINDDNAVLVEGQNFHVSKNDMFRTVFFNHLMFLSEALYNSWIDPMVTRYLFLRQSKFRDFVFSAVMNAELVQPRASRARRSDPMVVTHTVFTTHSAVTNQELESVPPSPPTSPHSTAGPVAIFM
eukprot:c15241_g1_i1.p1 GENE.c15241_g1_i1~~c15241_g1_i1.p1  ORF type:complete len:502 (+),score=127.57 c15241_g1_i1:536-2041(+)